MVGGDRSFKLALTEMDEEFSDELREDCEVRGIERSGVVRKRRGGKGRRSLLVKWFYPLTLVCLLEWNDRAL